MSPTVKTSESEPDEAMGQIDSGMQALAQFGLRNDGSQTMKAQAHFMASIAISLYELVELHRKYDVDNLRVEVDPGTEQSDEQLENLKNDDDVDEDIDGPGSGHSPVHAAQSEDLPERHVIDEVGSADYPYAR